MPSPKKRAADAAEEPADPAAQGMPAGIVMETWPIDRVLPYIRNPRVHAPETVARMAGAIREFGFRVPILALSDGTLVDGHLRLEAARQLGLATLPVVLADDLTAAQVKAFRILSRNSAAWSPWDDGLLRLELAELEMADFDLGLTGFAEAELADLLAEPTTAGLSDPDELPEPPPATSETGDVWLMGRHRLLVGDCFDEEGRKRLIGGDAVALVATDPPYAIYGSSTGVSSEVADDRMVRPFFEKVLKLAFGLLPWFGHCYLCCDWRSWAAIWDAAKTAKMPARNLIVWDKASGGMGSNYSNAYELVGFFAKLPPQNTMGDRRSGVRPVLRPNLVRFSIAKGDDRQHNAAKPVGLMEEVVTNSSGPDDVVFEPFCGSGTTVIACEKLGRQCRAVEVNPEFADISVVRWMTFTGEHARLEATGQTFGEVQEARGRAPAG